MTEVATVLSAETSLKSQTPVRIAVFGERKVPATLLLSPLKQAMRLDEQRPLQASRHAISTCVTEGVAAASSAVRKPVVLSTSEDFA